MGAVALVLLVFGLVLYLRSGEGEGSEAMARLGGESGRLASSRGGDGTGGVVSGESPSGPHAPQRTVQAVGDGGVPLRPVLARPSGPVQANRTVPPIDAPRSAQNQGRSAGWRLGETRRLIEIADSRITRLRAVLADLERQGDPDAIERQRAVLQRFETRMSDLREEEAAFEAQARQEGTLGEVQRGYDESETNEASRPVVRETAPGVIQR